MRFFCAAAPGASPGPRASRSARPSASALPLSRRQRPRARWVGSALALCSLFVSVTAGADKDASPAKKARGSIAECATFVQKDASETTVDFTVDNSCTVDVECTVTWSVTCAPDSRKKRSKKFEGASFKLASAATKTTTADAARCGDAGWAIDDVSWSCAPSKD